jgi:hypothetical protein
MLYRLANVMWLCALVYAGFEIIDLPRPDRKYALFAVLGLLAFRYVVGFGWLRETQPKTTRLSD